MTVALVVTTDGRHYLAQALASAEKCLPHFDETILVDDSGTQAAEPFYAAFSQVIAHEHREGLGQTVRDAWNAAADCDWVFHLEDDFVFEELVPLIAMQRVLEAEPQLTQMVLRRQHAAWEPDGGFIAQVPKAYTEHTSGNLTWLEHRRGFSFNPCLIPARVLRQCHGGTETDVSRQLGPDAAYAIWGARDDRHRVTHIGEFRSGGWRP